MGKPFPLGSITNTRSGPACFFEDGHAFLRKIEITNLKDLRSRIARLSCLEFGCLILPWFRVRNSSLLGSFLWGTTHLLRRDENQGCMAHVGANRMRVREVC